jgi:hypothetical protein
MATHASYLERVASNGGRRLQRGHGGGYGATLAVARARGGRVAAGALAHRADVLGGPPG